MGQRHLKGKQLDEWLSLTGMERMKGEVALE